MTTTYTPDTVPASPEAIEQSNRLRNDNYSRSITSAFDLIETRVTLADGRVTNIRFEVATSHWKERKQYWSKINRCTYTTEDRGSSTLFKDLMMGEPSPLESSYTPTSRFNMSAMADAHAAYIAQVLHPSRLPAIIEWAKREGISE